MSPNDPRWGNRDSNGGGKRGNNQGPPDLEEIWRDFNQRLSGLFGRSTGPSGPGGGGPGNSSPSSRQFSGGLLILALLVFVGWLASGFYAVDTNQRGVVLRLGKFNAVTQPGLNWRLPWPIETHETVDMTTLRTVSVGGDNRTLMLTDDLNIVSVQFSVQYTIESKVERKTESDSKAKIEVGEPKAEISGQEVEVGEPKTEVGEPKTEVGEPKTEVGEPIAEISAPKVGTGKSEAEASRETDEVKSRENVRDFLFKNRKPDEDFVRQVAESAVREIVGKNKMNFVLYEGRDQIGKRAQELIQSILNGYGSGIQVSLVTMEQVQPPEQVLAAFEDATKATQDEERQKSEGEAYAKNVIPAAQGTAARRRADAEAYRAKVIASAEGEAVRFRQVLAEFKRAPQVTRERMYLETVQQVLSDTTKVMIDDKGGSNLLVLPLDKLMQQTTARAAVTTLTGAGTGNILPSEPVPVVSQSPQSQPPQLPQPSLQNGPRDRDFLRNRDRGDR